MYEGLRAIFQNTEGLNAAVQAFKGLNVIYPKPNPNTLRIVFNPSKDLKDRTQCNTSNLRGIVHIHLSIRIIKFNPPQA